MDFFNFLKSNTPAFLASLAISFPASMLFVSQYYCAPQVDALKQANTSLQSSYDRLDKSYQEKKADFDRLDSSTGVLSTNLNKSNSELIVNDNNVRNLTIKINELNNEKEVLTSRLNQSINYNNSLNNQINNYKENDKILLKINKLEAEKKNLRDTTLISAFDNKTDRERRDENDKIAKELHEQILDLQSKLKCSL